MLARSLLLIAVATASVLVFNTSADAQQRAMRTMPNQFGRPAVYDLFQQNRGILPNYYQYYRPSQQLQRNLQTQNNQLQRQDYQLQRQGTAIQGLGDQTQNPPLDPEIYEILIVLQKMLRDQTQNPLQPPKAIRPTGRESTDRGSGFRNYSHFYPGLTGGNR